MVRLQRQPYAPPPPARTCGATGDGGAGLGAAGGRAPPGSRTQAPDVGRRRRRGSRSGRGAPQSGAAPPGTEPAAGPADGEAGPDSWRAAAEGKGCVGHGAAGSRGGGALPGPLLRAPGGGRKGAGPLGVVARGADPPSLVPRAGGAAVRGSMLGSGASRPR